VERFAEESLYEVEGAPRFASCLLALGGVLRRSVLHPGGDVGCVRDAWGRL